MATLQQIRRAIGIETGDMVVLTATADGDTTTFIDNQNLWMPDNACRGRILYFTDGTASNVAQKRVATGSTQSSTRVTWSVALPAATAEDDVAEMWNTRGTGFDPVQEVNTTINNAIRKALDYTWDVDMETVSGAFDADTGYFTIPSGTKAIYAVEYQNSEGFWHEIPYARDINRPGWHYERGGTVVWILGPWLTEADNRTIRLRRYTNRTVLSADSDETEISMEYLVAEVKATLLEAAFDRAPNERFLPQRWQKAVNEAQFKRAALGKRLMPNTVLVE